MIYLSGPISAGNTERNFAASNKLEEIFNEWGMECYNPSVLGDSKDGWVWADYMKASFVALASPEVKAIVMRPFSEFSRGAIAEREFALAYQIPIYNALDLFLFEDVRNEFKELCK